MSNPPSNLQSQSWMQRALARFRDSWQRASSFGGRLKFSPGWLAGVLLFALLAGGISLVALARERATKTEAGTTASNGAAKSEPAPAKSGKKHESKGVEKAASGGMSKSESSVPPAENKNDSEENPQGALFEQSPSLDVVGTTTAKPNSVGDAERIRARADWFYQQRAYPFSRIPPGARQKALQQLDQMILLQEALQSNPATAAQPLPAPPTPQAAGIIPFPGDSNWHLIGPQPTNQPFGGNSGSPTSSGRITAIAVDPSDATGQTIFIGGAAGGVWKTTDGGVT